MLNHTGMPALKLCVVTVVTVYFTKWCGNVFHNFPNQIQILFLVNWYFTFNSEPLSVWSTAWNLWAFTTNFHLPVNSQWNNLLWYTACFLSLMFLITGSDNSPSHYPGPWCKSSLMLSALSNWLWQKSLN